MFTLLWNPFRDHRICWRNLLNGFLINLYGWCCIYLHFTLNASTKANYSFSTYIKHQRFCADCYSRKNSCISASSALLILRNVRTVMFVLPDSMRDILAFSKLHCIASSFWVIAFLRRNSLILAPRLIRNFGSFINRRKIKYLEDSLITRCLPRHFCYND